MAAIRRAEATWSGALTSGSGEVSAISSGAFSALPVTWASRTETSDGRTSPEELVAAAHASCFAMALSGALARAGTPPERLDVSAEVTFDKLEPKQYRLRLQVPNKFERTSDDSFVVTVRPDVAAEVRFGLAPL